MTAGPWLRLLEENVSDSASFDNAFELKLLEGFSADAAMLSMVPPAFENDPLLSRDVRGALASLAQHGEPWDGPAALVFSDGQFVGAKLDRNGLRPLRYTLTHDGLLIAGSEVGIIDLEESRIAERQRLGPGEMILANPATGAVFRYREILKRLATLQSRSMLPVVRQLGASGGPAAEKVERPERMAAAAGWTEDQFKILFSPLVQGHEANWSMGDDAPPAFLSNLPRTLWDYCKQRFAQVTNPPIDPLRESHVMSLAVHLKNGIVLPSPLIGAQQLAELSATFGPVQNIDFTFSAPNEVPGARSSLAQLTTPLSGSARPGLLLLSDRGISSERAALPALLATAAVWKAMVSEGLWDVPLIVESAQVFDTHHVMRYWWRAGAQCRCRILPSNSRNRWRLAARKRCARRSTPGCWKKCWRGWVFRRWRAIGTAIYLRLWDCRKICARNFSRMPRIFRGRKAWTICSGIICACTTRRFPERLNELVGCEVISCSGRARSYTRILRKLCGACMRTCARRRLETFPLSRNWRRAKGLCFCA